MTPSGVGYLIKSIDDKLRGRADAELRNSGLTFSQSRVLAFLNSKGGQATQKEIEDFLEVSHPTVVGIVSRMEQNGFLTTWFDAKRQRSKTVKLTQKARIVGEDMDSLIRKQEESMLEGMTSEEIAQFEKALLTVYRNLR